MKNLIMIALVLVSGCSRQPMPEAKEPRKEIAAYVDRFEDTDNGVVCYVYSAPGPRSGISCLKMNSSQ